MSFSQRLANWLTAASRSTRHGRRGSRRRDVRGAALDTARVHGLEPLEQRVLLAAAYEVWAGDTDFTAEPDLDEIYYSIDKHGYKKLGEANGDATFTGSYDFYVIASRRAVLIDAVQGSNGEYMDAPWWIGNTEPWYNVEGPPDDQYALMGYQTSGGTFRGFVVADNLSRDWSSIRVLTNNAPELRLGTDDPVWLVAAPGQTVSLPVEVLNVGVQAATPVAPAKLDVAVYRSADPEVDGNDVKVGQFALTSLAGATSSRQTVNFTAPAQPGTYYLAAQADAGGAVTESDESNNWGPTIVLVVSPLRNADLTGAWSLAGMSERGSLTFNGKGAVSGGTIVSDSTFRISGGSYSLAQNGVFTTKVTAALPAPDNMFYRVGAVNPDKDVMTLRSAAIDPNGEDDAGMMVLVRRGTLYSNADVAGTWDVHGAWDEGTMTLDDAGNITGGTFIDVAGFVTTITGGSYTLIASGSNAGAITGTVNVSSTDPDAPPVFHFTGAVNAAKDLFTFTDADWPGNAQNDDDSNAGLHICIKRQGTYSDLDLIGEWSFTSPWTTGVVVFNGAGGIVGGRAYNDGGSSFIVTGGSYSVLSDGTMTGDLFMLDDQDLESEFVLTGSIAASKDVLVTNRTEVGATVMDDAGLGVLIRRTGNLTLSGDYGLVDFSQEDPVLDPMTFSAATGFLTLDPAGTAHVMFTDASYGQPDPSPVQISAFDAPYWINSVRQIGIADDMAGAVSADGSLAVLADAGQSGGQYNTSVALAVRRGSGLTNTVLTGRYNMVLWDSDHGSEFTSGLGYFDADGALGVGNFVGQITEVAQGQTTGDNPIEPGPINGIYTVFPDGNVALDNGLGFVSADGSLMVWAPVRGDPADEETGINVALKQGAGYSNAALWGRYYLVLHSAAATDDVTDLFTSGIGYVDLDGAGTYAGAITYVSQGQDSGEAAAADSIHGTYTVDSTGQIVLDGDKTGFVSADGSVMAFVPVPGSLADKETGIGFLIRAPFADPLPVVSVAPTDAAAAETGPGVKLNPGSFTITRTGGALGLPLTVRYAVAGSATNGTDYTALTGTAVIPANKTTTVVTVAPIDDALAESPETVQLTLLVDGSYQLTPTPAKRSGTVTIADNEPVVSIVATDAAAAETGPGVTPNPGAFTITRSGKVTATTPPLIVQYIVEGTATPGDDYVALPVTVEIPVGKASVVVPLNVLDDDLAEDPETVIVRLQADPAYNVDAAKNQGTVTIADNEPAISIVAIDAMAAETAPGAAANPGKFTVLRAGTVTTTTPALTVYYTITGTATNTDDYVTLTDSVVIPAGKPSAVIEVNPVDDNVAEPSETVILTLNPDAHYHLTGVAARRSATVTIADNEPTITITRKKDASEANGSTTGKGEFTVTRTGGSLAQDLIVNYAVAPSSTATPDDDYTALSGTVTIPAGKASTTIEVLAKADTLAESKETVVVALSADPNYHLASSATKQSATVSITDVLAVDFFGATCFDRPGSWWRYDGSGSTPEGSGTATVDANVSPGPDSDTWLYTVDYSDVNPPEVTIPTERWVFEWRSDGVYLARIGLGVWGQDVWVTFEDLKVSPLVLSGTFTDSAPFTTDLPPASAELTGTVTATTSLDGRVPVTIGQQTYQAYKITFRLDQTGSGWVMDNGTKRQGTFRETDVRVWYAVPGVGMVKVTGSASMSQTGFGQPSGSSSSRMTWFPMTDYQVV